MNWMKEEAERVFNKAFKSTLKWFRNELRKQKIKNIYEKV